MIYQKIIARIKLLIFELCVLSTVLALLIVVVKFFTSSADILSKILETSLLFSMIFIPLSIIQYVLIYLIYGKAIFDKQTKISNYRRFLFWLFMVSLLPIILLWLMDFLGYH